MGGPGYAPKQPEKPTEGWGVIRPGERRAHYYVSGMSLCCRVGFYNGPLEVEGGESPDDCAACRKKLARRPSREHKGES